MSSNYRRGNGRSCVVTQCKNNDYILWRWKHSICNEHLDDDGLPIKRMDCVCLIPLSFHKFPKSDAERHVWLQAIHRPDYKPNFNRAIVCSEHFIDGRPTKAHPYPTENIINITGGLWQEVQSWGKESVLQQTSSVNSFIAATGNSFLNDILKFANKNNEPTLFNEENSHSGVGTFVNENPEASSVVCGSIADNSNVPDNNAYQYTNKNGEMFIYVNDNSTEIRQTSEDAKIPKISIVETHSLRERLFSKPPFVVDDSNLKSTKKLITKSNGTQVDTSFFDYVSRKDCQSYTGLDFVHFCIIVELLSSQVGDILCKMDVSHQIFLTLTKLRQNYSFKELGIKFSISASLSNEIFKFWLSKMETILSEFVLGRLDQGEIRNYQSIRCEKYNPKATFVIKKLKLTVKRDKKHNQRIKKFFVVSTPSGYITNVSKLYPLGIADNFIIEDFGLATLIKPGDEIITSCIFKFDHIQTNLIGSIDNKAKIKLGKGVAKIQQFKILKNPVSSRFASNLDKIIKVCCALCNFQS